jgi:hypothetical protein
VVQEERSSRQQRSRLGKPLNLLLIPRVVVCDVSPARSLTPLLRATSGQVVSPLTASYSVVREPCLQARVAVVDGQGCDVVTRWDCGPLGFLPVLCSPFLSSFLVIFGESSLSEAKVGAFMI